MSNDHRPTKKNTGLNHFKIALLYCLASDSLIISLNLFLNKKAIVTSLIQVLMLMEDKKYSLLISPENCMVYL